MNSYYGTEARLLASRDWGEADKLLTFFTEELGRIDAIAKSVRLSKSKLKGHLTLFSRLRIMITPSQRGGGGREFWRLLDAEKDIAGTVALDRLSFAEEFSRFLLNLATGGEKSEELWVLCDRLATFSKTSDVLWAKIQALRSVGMLPGEDELSLFFTSEAIRFIENKRDGEFLADMQEKDAFDMGIHQILFTNHMV